MPILEGLLLGALAAVLFPASVLAPGGALLALGLARRGDRASAAALGGVSLAVGLLWLVWCLVVEPELGATASLALGGGTLALAKPALQRPRGPHAGEGVGGALLALPLTATAVGLLAFGELLGLGLWPASERIAPTGLLVSPPLATVGGLWVGFSALVFGARLALAEPAPADRGRRSDFGEP